jgi:hypothetical protein
MTPVGVCLLGVAALVGVDGWCSQAKVRKGRRALAWGGIITATVGSLLYLYATLSIPALTYSMAFANSYPYATGTVVEGIPWSPELREYLLTISSRYESADITNLRVSVYLPLPLLSLRFLSSPGCEGVSISQGQGESIESQVVEDGTIVRTFKTGRGDFEVAAMKVLPGGTIRLRAIGKINPQSPGVPTSGWVFQRADYERFGERAHYGVVGRAIPVDSDGRIRFGDEVDQAALAASPPEIPFVGSMNIPETKEGSSILTPLFKAP